MSYQKLTLLGNVTEPEVKEVNGNKVASFRLAASEKYTDRNGETHENTEWFSIVCWRKQADLIEKYVHKGDLLFIEGKIKNITEFGLFIGLSDEIDGMIHLSDISWEQPGEEAVKEYTKGQTIEAKIIDFDVEKERISLGIKQMSENNIAMTLESLKKGDIVKAVVTGADEKGVQVTVQGIPATIKKSELSKENNDPLSYKEGDILEAKLTSVDRKNTKLGVSVKAYEIEEEKKALEEYSNTQAAGSSLGEALGEALKNKE